MAERQHRIAVPSVRPRGARKSSRWHKIVRALVDRPSTIGELAQITGAKESAVTRIVYLLAGEGLVNAKGPVRRKPGARGGMGARVWRWEP
jgi:transcription initiation factor IIE alpha subunit